MSPIELTLAQPKTLQASRITIFTQVFVLRVFVCLLVAILATVSSLCVLSRSRRLSFPCACVVCRIGSR